MRGSPEPLGEPNRRYAASPTKNTSSGAATATVSVTPVPKRRPCTRAAVGTSVIESATE
jgi:hypothetical protein